MARPDLNARVSHSEVLKSVLRAQFRNTEALLEKARLAPGGDTR